MNWDRQKREKLARMIAMKCLEIQNHCISHVQITGENWPRILELTDERIMALLGPLGFERANKDWDESHEDVMLFKQSDTHLWFQTAQARIVRIEKTKAERVLVLGLP
jgi:hypothetical protein